MSRFENVHSVGEKYVCEDCIEDYAVQAFIRQEAVSHKCDYCGAEEQELIAAEVDSVIEFMLEGIETEWGEPYDEGNIYDGETGSWFNKVLNSWQLIDELEIPIDEDALREDICSALEDLIWCRRDPFAPSGLERLIWGWRDFAEHVKHHTRYVFFRAKSESEDPFHLDIDPSEMLDVLGETITQIDLTRKIGAGTKVFRARERKLDEHFTSAKELCSTPRKYAKYSNRMSPAGIPMYYGAFDQQTAHAEIGQPPAVTIGEFRLLQEINVIDLTSIPPVPSLFDPTQRMLRSGIMFMHNFAEEVSKPIEKDEIERIDYVPTQVFTEYFRYLYRDSWDQSIQGIVYSSARRAEGKSCVLFFENEHCCDELLGDNSDKDKWLKLCSYTEIPES